MLRGCASRALHGQRGFPSAHFFLRSRLAGLEYSCLDCRNDCPILAPPQGLRQVAGRFGLPWSHYVRLLALPNEEARRFYETEALRCGWSVCQLDTQISSQFYERTALSRNKVSMLKKAGKAEVGDFVTPEEEIKDPFVLEFLGQICLACTIRFGPAHSFHLRERLLLKSPGLYCQERITLAQTGSAAAGTKSGQYPKY